MGNADSILVVCGANGTATSLVLAMLNARPEIFLMHEVRPHHFTPGKYSRLFLKNFPETEGFFGTRTVSQQAQDRPILYKDTAEEILERYARIHAALEERGHQYRFFGDKVPTLDAAEATKLSAAPYFIFTARDIRTWLCREKIFRRPGVIQDAIPIIRQYVSLFMAAVAAEDALVLRTEDCILDNEGTMAQLVNYLDLPDDDRIGQWWNHVIPDEGSPKAVCHWFGQGADVPKKSAGLRPIELDVEFELRDHEVWDIILPTFDKYYDTLTQQKPPAAEVAAKLSEIDGALSEFSVPFPELYKNFTSWKFAHDEANRPTRRNVWKLLDDGRLLRPPREGIAQIEENEAQELIQYPGKATLVLVEQEDEPAMAVMHANLFRTRLFNLAMDRAHVQVIRMGHEVACRLLPELQDEFQPPKPTYLCLPVGQSNWQVLPDHFSLDILTEALAGKQHG